MNRYSSFAWLALLGSTTGASASANVLIVAPLGGDYTNIQAAINAAIDCDVILIKSGTYPGFVIENRDLEIVEDLGQTVNISGAVRVLHLSAGRDVLIDGFDVQATSSGPPVNIHGFSADDCAGSIRIQDCSFRAGNSLYAGARISDCADVVVMDSVFEGRRGSYESSDGLECVGSNVAMYGGAVRGALGGTVYQLGYGGNGGDGANVEASYVFAAGSSFSGGRGEDGFYSCGIGLGGCEDGGDGGDGIVGHLTSAIESVQTPFVAGGAGQGGCSVGSGCCCFDGVAGVPIDLATGATLTELPHFARHMSSDGPLREKTSTSIKLYGQPGDHVRLAMTEATHFAFDPASIGVQVFQPGPVTRQRVLGAIDSTGTLTFTLDLPDLGPGVASRTQYVQAIFRDLNGQQHLGTPRAVVVLDSAF